MICPPIGIGSSGTLEGSLVGTVQEPGKFGARISLGGLKPNEFSETSVPAIYQVPHPDMGEEVKAVVQPLTPPADPAALEAELIAFCRARLSAIKCPRSVDFVDALPRNDMGKLVKRLVKEPYWREHTRRI